VSWMPIGLCFVKPVTIDIFGAVQPSPLVKICILLALLGVNTGRASLCIGATQENGNYDRLDRAAELIRLGELARAATELEVVLRKRPREANALNLLGVVRAQQHRYVEAEQLFFRALKESPKLAGAFVNLGRLYLDQQKAERALWAFAEAGKLAPDDLNISFNLASLYSERQDFQRALAYLEKIPRSAWGIDELYLSTKCYLAAGRTKEAIDLVAPLKRPGALKADQAAGFAALFLKANLPDDALALLEGAREKEPNSFLLLYESGASFAQKKDWIRAEEFYAAALALKPESVATLRDLARIARVRGEFEKALAYPQDPPD